MHGYGQTDFISTQPPKRCQLQLSTNSLSVCLEAVTSVQPPRDFGIFIDSDLSMTLHDPKTVSDCFGINDSDQRPSSASADALGI